MRLSTDPKDFSAQSSALSLPSFGGKGYERDRSLIFVLLPLDDHEVVNSANIVEMQAISGQSFKYVLHHPCLSASPLSSSLAVT
jgi:hypothetical protein